MDDINLVFDNCKTFYDSNLPVVKMCNELETKFKELCNKYDYQRVLKLGNRAPENEEELKQNNEDMDDLSISSVEDNDEEDPLSKLLNDKVPPAS